MLGFYLMETMAWISVFSSIMVHPSKRQATNAVASTPPRVVAKPRKQP